MKNSKLVDKSIDFRNNTLKESKHLIMQTTFQKPNSKNIFPMLEIRRKLKSPSKSLTSLSQSNFSPSPKKNDELFIKTEDFAIQKNTEITLPSPSIDEQFSRQNMTIETTFQTPSNKYSIFLEQKVKEINDSKTRLLTNYSDSYNLFMERKLNSFMKYKEISGNSLDTPSRDKILTGFFENLKLNMETAPIRKKTQSQFVNEYWKTHFTFPTDFRQKKLNYSIPFWTGKDFPGGSGNE